MARYDLRKCKYLFYLTLDFFSIKKVVQILIEVFQILIDVVIIDEVVIAVKLVIIIIDGVVRVVSHAHA